MTFKLTMLDPSILVGPAAPQGQAGPLLPDAQATIQLAREAEARGRSLAAVIQLLAELDATSRLEEAAGQTARSLAEILMAGRVWVLWRQASRRGLSVIADSDHGSGEHQQSLCRLAIAAGEEIAAGQGPANWSARPVRDGHQAASGRCALMATTQLANRLSADSLIGITLADSDDRDRGVVLVIDPSTANATGFLRAIEAPLTSKLVGIERMQPTKIQSALGGIVDVARSSRRKLVLAVAAAVGIVMWLPLPYRVAAELELQPIKHRFVAVPFDGPLESARVRPGDVVRQGDLLATINPREIEYELAGIRAQWKRAVQQKKGSMAEHDVAGSKLAALESDRLRLQSDLLQYQRDNLEIRSPISGVVVSGDLKESEGMPMSRGETLFEIAPLGHMVVEIAVPEADVNHVRPGMRADFYVHALPNRTIRGKIARLHPRAELRDHDNAFIAEVHVRDSENLLRPGMRGRAKIFSDRHPLGWNLFHKAYHALRHTVGW